MSELELNLGGEIFQMRRDNTSLFRFAGELAIYDHVFFVQEELEPGRIAGTYLFAANPAYPQIRAFIEQHNYPQHINLQEAAQCDIDAWNHHYLKDLNDMTHVPEGWEGQS